MSYLKFTAAALAAVSFASATVAGSLAAPEVEAVVEEVVEEAAGSSAGSSGGGVLLPLLGLAAVAALVASQSSDDS
jgi:hypothetical protein